MAACKVVAAGNRTVLQPENQGGSYIEDVRSKRRKRLFERNGVFVLPCWVVEGDSPETTGASGRVAPKRPTGLPVSPVTTVTSAQASGPLLADESGPVPS